MTINRRTFLKGIAAAPFALSALEYLFAPDARGDTKELLPIAKPSPFTEDLLFRQAISIRQPITIKEIRRAKQALMGWVKAKGITADPKRVRFFYAEDDFGNEIGVAVSIYKKPREDIGVTWGQVERLVLER